MEQEQKRTDRTLPLSDVVQWDVRNWSGAVDFWARHSSIHISNSIALEVGSHNGGLSLWMASQGATVVCSDLNGATKEAIKKHTEHGVSHQISYEAIDATDISYSDHFDIIFFKSVLGGIGSNGNKGLQAKAIGQMHKALKKGGQLFFAENLVASPLHNLLRQRFVKWGTEWRYVSIAEMREFLSPFSAVTYRTIGFLGTFGRTEKQKETLSWLDKYLIGPVVPTSWRYIVAGVATK